MSEQTEKGERREAGWAEWGWRVLVWVIVAILVLMLVAHNTGPVRVGIFFVSWQVSLALWSLICLIVGVAATMALVWSRRRR